MSWQNLTPQLLFIYFGNEIFYMHINLVCVVITADLLIADQLLTKGLEGLTTGWAIAPRLQYYTSAMIASVLEIFFKYMYNYSVLEEWMEDLVNTGIQSFNLYLDIVFFMSYHK